MLCMAVALAGHDSLQLEVPALCYAYWFATPTNRWDELITPYLPKWCTVWDKSLLKRFYSRGSSLYIYEHLLAWGRVALWWSLFILALGAVIP
ncbi:MAG TPA: hypothetical protein EYP65_08575, partial [Armatimonadetes bacterium]|nr:hypothetical protein [Armatimonadota bacterium]